jgi:hypothetical protein
VHNFSNIVLPRPGAGLRRLARCRIEVSGDGIGRNYRLSVTRTAWKDACRKIEKLIQFFVLFGKKIRPK